jgi:transcriptional regulator with XRE-family HTH domain
MSNTFAERLKNAMEQADMSQSALSEKAGASKAAISQYLSGKNIPTRSRVKALADATDVSFDYLMGYDAPTVKDQPVPLKKITTDEAARCLGKSRQFVRIGLQRGLLPFGNAVPGVGESWNYYISPAKFKEYVGVEQFNSFFGLTV